MDINKEIIKEERVSTFITEKELKEIIVKYISVQAGFIVTGDTMINITFSKNDKGCLGFLLDTQVELINNINKE